MKKRKKVKYTEETIEGVIIRDFLPPPDKLVFKEPQIKVTLTLSKRSLDFFKKHAKKEQVPYQAMIRSVVDLYAQHADS